eukprot:1649344-Ditylum_brightwellii.AAC.1
MRQRSHTKKRIGLYLKGTRENGMILNPAKGDSLNIDYFVDSGFLGLCGSKNPEYRDSVHSRTDCVICVAGCPITWGKKLQTEIATSTMMADYIALSTAMRELLPLQWLVEEVSGVTDLKKGQSQIRFNIWEDNSRALTSANLKPGRLKLGRPDEGKIWVKKND